MSDDDERTRPGPKERYGPRGMISFRPPLNLLATIEAEAERREVSRSELIILTLQRVSRGWPAV